MVSKSQTKPIVGIVGGVGSGKTTVAGALALHGGVVIDCDAIGHELLGDETVRRELRECWGEQIFDAGGCVDRRALGNIVFADPRQLDTLNAIMHPRIAAKIEQLIAAANADPKVSLIIVDAAVLFEAGWDKFCTHTVFVDAPLSQRLERVIRTRSWDEQTLLARESSQISLDTKAARCSHTVVNCSAESHLSEQILKLVRQVSLK